MASVTQPTQQELQAWLKQRHESKAPLPSMEEIRRQLGWKLLNNSGAECAR